MGRIYLDTEFNGFKGELLSVGLINDAGASLYAVFPPPPNGLDLWVATHVVPILDSVPRGIPAEHTSITAFQKVLQRFLRAEGEEEIRIVTDWPDDVKYFSELLITGPGKMIDIPGIVFEVVRVDAYVSPPMGAVQHNAMWDAIALRYCLTGEVGYWAF